MTGIGRIEAMGVDMGDEILVVKANDVIPYVERVTTKHSSRKHFVFPSACPSCGHSVSRMGESIVCTSLTCPGKIGSRIEGWISTAGMDGLGPAMVQTVMRHGIVRRCADLYAMTVEDLSRTPYSGDHQRSVGDKIAKKIVASIAKSTGMPLARALGGSGIDSLGERQAQKWLDAQSRSQVTWQEVISSIRLGTWATWLRDGDGSGIGPTKANAMATDAASCVDDLEALWSAVKPEPYVRQAAVATPGGFVVCLTGSFDVPKSQIAAAIAARGHTVVDAVTSACTHVVQADPSIASGKSKAAVKRGIPVITWDQMRALL
jgi:DNA ligase (NAD+)